MPVAATRPHIAAVRALLVAAGLTVQLGGDGEPVAPCVVLWPSPGEPAAGSVADPVGDLVVELTATAVGSTPDQALWVSDRVTTTLAQAVPVVAGRSCRPMWQTWRAPLARDDDSTPPTWFASTRWRLTSS